MKKCGFTLIELVILLSIIGIIAATAMVSGSPKGAIRLHAASQKLTQDLRYMQEMAMLEQVRFGISFDTANESYFGYRVTTATKATDPQTQSNLEIDFDSMKEFKEIGISSTNLSGNVIEFDPAGIPYGGNGVALSTQAIVTLTDGTNSKTVRIEAETGKVSIQ
ncbi:MAG: prepilin-type N-terminal cleavage/methylation domain-containing protein [Candidatus Omnitrophota bacterium]|nr:prepilin-type N-terminal cleavage/methylation domain-containing protein [Candidatus Omnitrophota bacterium]